MPTNDSSIGFINKLYPQGFRNGIDYQIDNDFIIKILSAPTLSLQPGGI